MYRGTSTSLRMELLILGPRLIEAWQMTQVSILRMDSFLLLLQKSKERSSVELREKIQIFVEDNRMFLTTIV